MNQEVHTLRLQPRSPSSFWTANGPALADWLGTRGYSDIPTRNPLEYIRLQNGQALIVIFKGGTVSAQGSNAAAAVKLLETLEVQS